MNNDDLEEMICECGHVAADHHVSWFWGGHRIIDECEAHGYNESGGFMFVDGEWVDHCQQFRLAS